MLNHILGRKVSIVSHHPQTTRLRVLGVSNEPGIQFVWMDTPGLSWDHHSAAHRRLYRQAVSSLHGVDVIVLVLDGLHWRREDQKVYDLAREWSAAPVVVAINKVDRIRPRDRLLPHMTQLGGIFGASVPLIPISARDGSYVDSLMNEVRLLMPEREPMFPPDYTGNLDWPARAAECLREKLLSRLRRELPYHVCVTPLSVTNDGDITHVRLIVWVTRKAHKPIVIGAKGSLLKEASQQGAHRTGTGIGQQGVSARPGTCRR